MRTGRSPWRVMRDRREQRGAAAVEFALVVPILLLLLFGIMDFGYLINRASMINNAARDAAREASLGAPLADVQNVATTALNDVPSAAVAVTCKRPAGGSCTYGDAASGDTAVVTITYVHQMITPIGMFFDSLDISRTAEMRIE